MSNNNEATETTNASATENSADKNVIMDKSECKAEDEKARYNQERREKYAQDAKMREASQRRSKLNREKKKAKRAINPELDAAIKKEQREKKARQRAAIKAKRNVDGKIDDSDANLGQYEAKDEAKDDTTFGPDGVELHQSANCHWRYCDMSKVLVMELKSAVIENSEQFNYFMKAMQNDDIVLIVDNVIQSKDRLRLVKGIMKKLEDDNMIHDKVKVFNKVNRTSQNDESEEESVFKEMTETFGMPCSTFFNYLTSTNNDKKYNCTNGMSVDPKASVMVSIFIH